MPDEPKEYVPTLDAEQDEDWHLRYHRGPIDASEAAVIRHQLDVLMHGRPKTRKKHEPVNASPGIDPWEKPADD
jgi:hypothetical protein